ncbi:MULTISPECIES: viroplasmin family protein [unclassified Brevibacillus]|uniref:ribonuclease H1 domain-containing protein n=1 Tax=unclassified Brevibacillus TaxID=2684853 RepID=UPI003568DC13
MEKNSKVYAVKKGRKTGIFQSWSECEKQIKGFSGAEYKSFSNISDAKDYLDSYRSQDNKLKENPEAQMVAYVDGSFDSISNSYGSGVVILFNGEKITLQSNGNDPTLVDMRNVAGEIIGAQMAMDFALEQSVKSLNIIYDYEGIEKWCTNAWEAKKVGTKQYKEHYLSVSNKVEIYFTKVKAHSGNVYNEEADRLAKASLSKQKNVNQTLLNKEDVNQVLPKEVKKNNGKMDILYYVHFIGTTLSSDKLLNEFKNEWKRKGRKINEIIKLEFHINTTNESIEWVIHTIDGVEKEVIFI